VNKPFGGRMVHPDSTMVPVFGTEPLLPTQIPKKFFKYVKRRGLLDGRYVEADENLRPLIGKGKQKTFSAIKKIWKYIKRRKLYK